MAELIKITIQPAKLQICKLATDQITSDYTAESLYIKQSALLNFLSNSFYTRKIKDNTRWEWIRNEKKNLELVKSRV